MKTAIVWIMLSFVPGQQCQNLKFPTQQSCEHFAHDFDWQARKADVKAPPSVCVKTNIVVESNDVKR